MFELTLSTSIDKQQYLHVLYKKLQQEIKSGGGIITKHNHLERSYLVLAVHSDKKEYYKSKIIEHIVFMIVDDYKYNFYKENLEPSNSSILFNSFLNAISIFDADFDRDFITRQIEFSKEIYVDRFFYFKLQDLKEKWDKTVQILKLNDVINNNEAMIEIIRYLTAVSENKVMKFNVYVGKNQIKTKGYLFDKLYKNNKNGQSDLLSEIIKLNPCSIILKVSKLSDGYEELVGLLSQIFLDKIYLQNWFYNIDKLVGMGYTWNIHL